MVDQLADSIQHASLAINEGLLPRSMIYIALIISLQRNFQLRVPL